MASFMDNDLALDIQNFCMVLIPPYVPHRCKGRKISQNHNLLNAKALGKANELPETPESQHIYLMGETCKHS